MPTHRLTTPITSFHGEFSGSGLRAAASVRSSATGQHQRPEKAPLSHSSSRQLRRLGLQLAYATLAWNVVG
jgi:hypothetical protein